MTGVQTCALPILQEPAPHLVAFAGALDLDHARAEVGEQPRAVRAREHTGEVEYGETVEQGSGHARLRVAGYTKGT